jgi:hypothetical protein
MLQGKKYGGRPCSHQDPKYSSSSMKDELAYMTLSGVLTNEPLEAARLIELHAVRHDPDVAKRSVQLLPEDLLEDVSQASGEDQHGDALGLQTSEQEELEVLQAATGGAFPKEADVADPAGLFFFFFVTDCLYR